MNDACDRVVAASSARVRPASMHRGSSARTQRPTMSRSPSCSTAAAARTCAKSRALEVRGRAPRHCGVGENRDNARNRSGDPRARFVRCQFQAGAMRLTAVSMGSGQARTTTKYTSATSAGAAVPERRCRSRRRSRSSCRPIGDRRSVPRRSTFPPGRCRRLERRCTTVPSCKEPDRRSTPRPMRPHTRVGRSTSCRCFGYVRLRRPWPRGTSVTIGTSTIHGHVDHDGHIDDDRDIRNHRNVRRDIGHGNSTTRPGPGHPERAGVADLPIRARIDEPHVAMHSGIRIEHGPVVPAARRSPPIARSMPQRTQRRAGCHG